VLRVVDITSGERCQWGSVSEGWHSLKQPELSAIQRRVPPGDRERRHFHSKARQFFACAERSYVPGCFMPTLTRRSHECLTAFFWDEPHAHAQREPQ
jgi:hypothetical protein